MRTWKRKTPEFKQQALQRMQTAQDIGLLAKELGISVRSLYRWKDRQLGREKKVREPEPREKKLEEEIHRLKQSSGDVYDTASLATLIRGNEAIISAFNPGWKNPNLYDDQVRGTAYGRFIAMRIANRRWRAARLPSRYPGARRVHGAGIAPRFE